MALFERNPEGFNDAVSRQRESRKSFDEAGSFKGIQGMLSQFPQELYSESQPNGIRFLINARSNSAAAVAAKEAGNAVGKQCPFFCQSCGEVCTYPRGHGDTPGTDQPLHFCYECSTPLPVPIN